jgi:esterase/lipase superfamily enzyme
MKDKTRWYSGRLEQEVDVVRWGTHGTPVLLFPTAAGDAEECERFLMLNVLGPLMEEGRIKVYSVDSVAGEALFSKDIGLERATWIQNQFHEFIYHEVVPAIRSDCKSDEIEVVSAGSSIGAFHAVAVLCRYPDAFAKAICMSGTYDLTKFTEGRTTASFHQSSPIHFLPDLQDGEHLEKLRERFVLLTHGEGRWEEPSQSWRMAEALGAKGIPNRVDAWGEEWDHDWPTWREMLPLYLRDLVPVPETTA